MSSPTPIPLVDLRIQHQQVADEVLPGITAVMESGAFVGGPDVAAFEAEYAAFAGARHCIGVGNGTDALELALRKPSSVRGCGSDSSTATPSTS